MKSLIRVLVAFVLGAIVILPLNGCCVDEPVIIVPDPEPAGPVIKGTVHTNDNVVLEGASITITGPQTYTAVTDENGSYSVTVQPGVYAISASKQGYSYSNDEVTAENDAVTLWNAFLFKPIVVSGQIKAGEDTYIEIPLPPLVKEASMGNEFLTAFIKYQTTSEDDELVLEFYYDATFIDETKVSRLLSLVNVKFYLKSGEQLTKPITITVSTPAKPEYVKLNDETIEYTYDEVEDIATIVTQEVGHLVFFYWVDIDEHPYGTELISFEQNVYDNRYGSAPMRVVNPVYTFHSGGKLTGNHVLINSLAASYTGAPVKTSATAVYPLDYTLPVGGKLILSGYQDLWVTEFDVANGLMHSEVIEYKDICISTETRNKEHIGGSN